MNRKDLLKHIKTVVQKIEPDAEILLYGSRARGDNKSESDWDFLILLDGTIDEKRKQKIRRNLYEVEWKTGNVISSIIHSRNDWNTPLFQITPFYINVTSQGIKM